MKGSLDQALKQQLKAMIIEECDIPDITPEEVADNIQIFSDASGLGLDSLDALQISMALQRQFGIHLPDSKAFRQHLKSINSLADYIQPE
jgi:acyl carrier protein